MNSKWLKFIPGVLILSLLFSIPICAQSSGATLSGMVTDSSGSPVANARITVSNVFTGQTAETQTDASGRYSVSKLGPGSYEVTALAEGIPSSKSRLTLAAGATKTLNLQLEGSSSNSTAQSGGTEPSLSSLGFPSSEVQGSAKEQARLNRRTRMLQIHQKLGMATVAVMVAALIASGGAKGEHGTPGSSTGRNVHMALGATTAGLYAATAYFALAAPRMPGVAGARAHPSAQGDGLDSRPGHGDDRRFGSDGLLADEQGRTRARNRQIPSDGGAGDGGGAGHGGPCRYFQVLRSNR